MAMGIRTSGLDLKHGTQFSALKEDLCNGLLIGLQTQQKFLTSIYPLIHLENKQTSQDTVLQKEGPDLFTTIAIKETLIEVAMGVVLIQLMSEERGLHA